MKDPEKMQDYMLQLGEHSARMQLKLQAVEATVKESEDGQFVAQTLERSKLWEIQTPQVAPPSSCRVRGCWWWFRAARGGGAGVR